MAVRYRGVCNYVIDFAIEFLSSTLMAVWFIVPATDSMLSFTTTGVQIPAWAFEKVASDLGLGRVFFSGYSIFIPF